MITLNRWDVTPQDAIQIQEMLRHLVITNDDFAPIHAIAGADCSFLREENVIRATVVVYSYPDLQVQEDTLIECQTTFPYIPGLLSFREAPAIIQAYSELRFPPDLLLCDGHGLAHPRRFGLASHLGVILNLPSIGIAKSRLIGAHTPVADERGAWQSLLDGNEIIGAVLRTQPGVKPIYISIGHRISLKTAIQIVLQATLKFRLPEPCRQAHRLAINTL